MSTNVSGLPDLMVNPSPCAESVPPIEFTNGWMMLVVNAVTIAVKAAPTTTATARSMTFPRMRKSLKPLNM